MRAAASVLNKANIADSPRIKCHSACVSVYTNSVTHSKGLTPSTARASSVHINCVRALYKPPSSARRLFYLELKAEGMLYVVGAAHTQHLLILVCITCQAKVNKLLMFAPAEIPIKMFHFCAMPVIHQLGPFHSLPFWRLNLQIKMHAGY